MSKNIYKELIAFHPGCYVKNIIDDMEITQSEFAKRLNTTDKTLSKLINGEISLSKNLANKLSLMTGTSIDLWLNLQKNYESKCNEIDLQKQFDEELTNLKFINYSYFSKLNLVPKTNNKIEQIRFLCKYLHISSLSVLKKPDLLVACKTAINSIELKNIMAANAWIQTGMNLAQNIDCAKFNKSKLINYLPKIRSLNLKSPNEFYHELKTILSNCGIAFVTLPYLDNSGLNGAIKWISKEKVLLLINDRGKDASLFWFALFHEIKHILQEDKKYVYLSIKDKSSLSLGINNSFAEQEADMFAREYLIAENDYTNFISHRNFSKSAIITFAKTIGVIPAIVLGRLQHDKYLKWNMFSDLKKEYRINSNKGVVN